jgi:hypothetical protein
MAACCSSNKDRNAAPRSRACVLLRRVASIFAP